MAMLQATCDSCGHKFPSGIAFAEGARSTIARLRFGPCPRCGSMGSVVDGEYQSTGGAVTLVKLLTDPSMTAERLGRIKEILEDAKREGASSDDVKARLEGVGPGLSKLLDLTNRTSGLATWAGLLISVVTWLHGCTGQVSESDVERMINERLQQQQSAPAPARPAPFDARAFKLRDISAAKGQSQNSICHCGSGKKYKHCHGQKRWGV